MAGGGWRVAGVERWASPPWLATAIPAERPRAGQGQGERAQGGMKAPAGPPPREALADLAETPRPPTAGAIENRLPCWAIQQALAAENEEGREAELRAWLAGREAEAG